jgi:hypothetical protein
MITVALVGLGLIWTVELLTVTVAWLIWQHRDSQRR